MKLLIENWRKHLNEESTEKEQAACMAKYSPAYNLALHGLFYGGAKEITAIIGDLLALEPDLRDKLSNIAPHARKIYLKQKLLHYYIDIVLDSLKTRGLTVRDILDAKARGEQKYGETSIQLQKIKNCISRSDSATDTAMTQINPTKAASTFVFENWRRFTEGEVIELYPKSKDSEVSQDEMDKVIDYEALEVLEGTMFDLLGKLYGNQSEIPLYVIERMDALVTSVEKSFNKGELQERGEQVDPRMKKHLKDNPYMEPDGLQERRWEDFGKPKGQWHELSPSEIENAKDPLDVDVSEELFALIDNAYKDIGGNFDYKSPGDIPGDADKWAVIDLDDDPEPDALKVAKQKEFGLKSTAAGNDGTRAAIEAYKNETARLLGIQGNYGEMSKGLAHVMLKYFNTPYVDNPEVVQKVLGPSKPIKWLGPHPDGKYPGIDGWYTRSIKGKKGNLKIMLGKPNV
jgi:hypothetical protein